MDITQLPFNAHVGITRSERDGYQLQLEALPHHENHIGTIHAAALFSLAEACSGEFLLQNQGDRPDIIGLVRRSSSKYSRPVKHCVYAKAISPLEIIEEARTAIEAKGKVLTTIKVELCDNDDRLVASFEFVWLLSGNTLDP